MTVGPRPSAKRYTLFLVNPALSYLHHSTGESFAEIMGKKANTVPLVLPLLAGLTPAHYDVHIINDETQAFPAHIRPDIVAFTALVTNVDRAYALADRFRAQGAVIAIGGVHVSTARDEAAAHADAVFIGEGEEIWPRFLADFEAGSVRQFYEADGLCPFKTQPVPRWDLVNGDELLTVVVQTSRGCPFNCEFCVVSDMFGRKVRYRDIDDVVREIRAAPLKTILFSDDNFTINKKRARKMVAALKPLGISWLCQASIELMKDPELVRMMADAGCIQILIGFESLDEDSLEETRKRHNRVEEYAEAVRVIHDAGVHVVGSFIVGFDHDTTEAFERIYRFVQEQAIIFPLMSLLTAVPGTELHRRLEREGRTVEGLDRRWHNGVFPNLRYANLSMVEALDGYVSLLERVFDPAATLERAKRLYSRGTFRRDTSPHISVLQKARTFLWLVRRYLLSPDKKRRELFTYLFRLAQVDKRLAMDKVVVMLLQTEANQRYLTKLRAVLPRVRREALAHDRARDRRAAPENSNAASG